MKNKIALLIIGVVLGLLINRFFDRNLPTTKITSEVQQNREDSPVAQADLTAPAHPEPQATKQIKTVSNGSVDASRPELKDEQPTMPPAQPEKLYGVRIEESVVRELEEEKENLKKRAYAELRDDGWQIHITEPDPALLHSGLSDGDIITHESIRAQLLLTDRTALVNRFVALLKYIER